MSETKKKTVADHIRHILSRLVKLENRVQFLEERDEGAQAPLDREVLAQVVQLENRLKQIEAENRELSNLCTLLREQHEAISNLYVAKHRLHASFDAGEIMNIVTEILSELVGAEEFAILFLEQKKKLLRRVAGKGAERMMDAVPLGEGLVGEVARNGNPYYRQDGNGAEPGSPLAVIPLKAEAQSVGVIAIYRLLSHKDGFTPVDHQLLELVAEHTPSALLSARLHRLSKSQRGS